jgi:hypothetical protein
MEKERIQYNELDVKVISYLIQNWKGIGEEYKLRGDGDIIHHIDDPMFGSTKKIGFFVNITKKIRVKFIYNMPSHTIIFFYNDIEIMTGYLYTNGYSLEDGYKRDDENSRHDLKKGFKFFIDHINNDLRKPHIKNIEEQKLYKDRMFDEYLEKIEDTSRFLD